MTKDFLYSNKGGGAGTGEVQFSSALDTQIDGSHYKQQKMQPIELAYRVNGSPCFTKLAKYASRRKVDRLGDLKKAIHCIQLEQELCKLSDNVYTKIRTTDTYFYQVLRQFCDNGFLFDALDAMYHGEYEDAINNIEMILFSEGLQ